MSRLIDSLHSHPARQTCVANKSADVMILALAVSRNRHPQCSRNRGRGVTRAERVVLRFIAPQETRDTAVLLDRWQCVAPACKNFVRVSLVAYVPDYAITRRVESIMKRNGKLHCAKGSASVTPNARHSFQDVLTNLVRHRLQLLRS